jgi:hypothetical protein
VVLPLDVPILPGAQVMETSDGRVMVHINTSLDVVDRFYQDQLPLNGWVLSYRSSLSPGKCVGENCIQTTGVGQIWVKAGSSLQVLLTEDETGTLLTINLFTD